MEDHGDFLFEVEPGQGPETWPVAPTRVHTHYLVTAKRLDSRQGKGTSLCGRLCRRGSTHTSGHLPLI